MHFSFFSFSFVFIGLAYGVSSLAFFILALCVAWLSASLSFAFSRLAYAPSFLVPPVLSALSFLPTVVFLQCFPDFVRYFLFLCVLLVIVSSVFSCFVSVFLCFSLFMVRLSCVFLTSLRAFPVLFEFLIFSAASASFSYLSFLLSSSGILSSSSCFHRIFWGLIVLGVAISPAVPAVAPPFFALLYPLHLFCMLRLRLPLEVFLGVFPHAVATAGFSSLACFPLAAATAVPCCLPQLFSLMRLRLLLHFWHASCCLSCCRFSICGSSVVQVLLFPVFLLIFYRRDFTE